MPPPLAPALRRLRLIWLQFGAALVVLLPLLVLAGLPLDGFPIGWLLLWLVVAVAATALALFTRPRATERMLAAGSADEIVARYQTRFFLGAAFSEVPALVGFAVAFAVDSLLPYLFGLPVSLVLLLWVGPHSADIRALDEAALQHGSAVRSSDALTAAG